MFENISGISIKGAMFSAETSLKFFERPTERLSLVYGKNGSGKSTISRAFLKCDDTGCVPGFSAQLIGNSNTKLDASQQQKESIHVFNEDYIQRNVRVQENGLNAIVLFGEQLDLEEKIVAAEKVYAEAEEKFKKQEIEGQKYNGNSSVSAPGYHLYQMKALLQGDDSWAGIDKRIKENRQNSPVNDSVALEIASLAPTRSKEETKKEFDCQMLIFQKMLAGAAKIQSPIRPINEIATEDNIIELLSKKIEQPTLTEREQLILNMVVDGKQNFFEEVKVNFSNPDAYTCPYCLQPISTEYKGALILSIEKVLNKDVEIHIEKLKTAKIATIDFNRTLYEALDVEQIEKCVTAISDVNGLISQYNMLLERKSGNVYLPIECEKKNIQEKLIIANTELATLEELRNVHNCSIDQKTTIRDSLLSLNKEMAHFTIQEHKTQYDISKRNEASDKANLGILAETLKKAKESLDALIQQKKSVKIAVEYINRGLQYVFFTNKRLELRLEEDTYALFSNGYAVKPSDVSCGERNIIALCYFFTQIMSNQNETDMYAKECLLIIDDPVSSFDMENRIGILSYLKSQILRIMLGNHNSKVVVFSHDLSSFFDLEKAFNEIKEAYQHKYSTKNAEYSLLELKERNLSRFLYNKRNEYTLLLESIFRYAIGQTSEDELVIGNIMRRTLEAFSTFEFKKGIDSVSCDQSILILMGNQRYADYFENLMYRLVLNGESHSEERIRGLQDTNFFSTITSTEKMRTAKDILCFISLLNRKHIESHLQVIQNSMQTIDGWCQNILTV